MPTAQRNARLDALAQAVRQYADKRRKHLKKRVEVSKNILRGRTGAERLAHSSVAASTELVVQSIGDFLTGENL